MSRLLVCDVKAVIFLGMIQKRDSALLGVSCSVSIQCVLNDEAESTHSPPILYPIYIISMIIKPIDLQSFCPPEEEHKICLVVCRNPKRCPTNGLRSAKGRFLKLLLSVFLSQMMFQATLFQELFPFFLMACKDRMY